MKPCLLLVWRRRSMACRLGVGWGLALCLAVSPASGWELDGTKQLVLHTRDGQSLTIGSVLLTPLADGQAAFSVTLDRARLTDHFLSMKEFKCLGGADELMCHVPYPYANPGTVSRADTAWLEHALLFLFKRPGEFGAKLWNGLYFRLQPAERGWVGTPQAIDLNHISAPPARPAEPPYRPALRNDIAPGARWAERITLE